MPPYLGVWRPRMARVSVLFGHTGPSAHHDTVDAQFAGLTKGLFSFRCRFATVPNFSCLRLDIHVEATTRAQLAASETKMGDTHMRKLCSAIAAVSGLLAVPIVANAADLPVKAAPAPVYLPPPFTWTGLYIGGNIGGAWAQSNWSDTLFGLSWGRSSDARFLGGGQIGFNYQFTNFVIGAEADFDWLANNNNNNTVIGPAGNVFQVTSNDTGIATLAARFGFANDHWLFYGKAGGGWVGNNGFTVANLTTGQAFVGSNSNTASGWLVGAGFEYGFTNNWTMKFEYDYLGLSGRSFTLPGVVIPALAGDTISSSHNVQMVKLGINYLFNWSNPVGARY
jgi:outer membrane immunogenic protein